MLARNILLLSMIILSTSCKATDHKIETSEKIEKIDQNEKIDQKESINIGIGPVKKIDLSPIDASLAEQGKKLFEAKCSACHKIGERYVGPNLKDVTKRRGPEWIMNMILNPIEMTQEDPVAKELIATYLTQMTFQNISEEEARKILEYFRQIDG